MSQNNRDTFHTHNTLPPLFRDFGNVDILAELCNIRQELKELKETLNPPKSVLIVGPEVERILASLHHKTPQSKE